GPIGGMIGTKYLAEEYNITNLIASDVGGTSFDVGILSKMYIPTKWESSLGKFILNIPMIALDSIGAGTGMYVRYNDISGRLEFGPESAGHLIGVCNKDSGVETVTMTDCSLILGYINPDYFLGGKIPLNKKRAYDYINEQIAEPLNSSPYETARGALDLIDLNMKNHLNGMIQGLGFRPENYTLVSYGGAGPLHVAGYSHNLQFEDIIIPEWAAAFSAFGCACADHSYRHEKTVDLILTTDGRMDQAVVMMLNATWAQLKSDISKEFKKEGRNPSKMIFKPSLKMQYLGMLDDLEVESPFESIQEQNLDELKHSYDELFEQIFKRGTKSPELGYHITKAIGTGIVPVPKPKLPKEEYSGKNPMETASKGYRDIYWEDEWHNASVWEMSLLKPGNVIEGASIIEAPATTLLVPPKHKVSLDKHRIFHMEVEK
ncbi:MAG: hydantoinase/oxoprolinase family protein, partial [Promethearchaeota archaeon]